MFYFLDNLDEIAVRKTFKFIAENLAYEVIEEKLTQEGFLCNQEKDDYVCKLPSKCFWVENLIKLMITKKHCTEFVEIISKMPCHQHVYKTIAEARRLVREPGPQHRNTNCNVVKSTKHVLFANELANKHLCFKGKSKFG